jgi:hypothetical protein
MAFLYRLILLITGVVHLLPFSLAFFANRIPNSYGVSISDPNMQLLLRHRAFLFGIIGFGLIFSAIKKKYYLAASVVGLVSMVSFICLYHWIGDINAQLQSVMWVDMLVGAALLLITVLYYRHSQNAKSNL